MRTELRLLITAILATAVLTTSPARTTGQQPANTPAEASQPMPVPSASSLPAGTAWIGLQDAFALARKNEPTYHSARSSAAIAREDRAQARDALLPSVNFDTSALYSQLNDKDSVKFIANNAPHEYVGQGNVHEQIDLASVASYRRAAALAALAKARAEIAARGLVVTVTQSYFAVAASEAKLHTARRASEEGDKFLQLTKDLEAAGEVAHSDVIKAELQSQDRHRQLMEAQLQRLKARLDLSVLLFPDARDNFELADDLHANVSLPPLPEFEAQAARDNPDIRAALASVQAAHQDVTAARSGYLPSLSLDYWYGIDATRYATYSPPPPGEVGKINNLGSSALAGLSLPLWNWGATQSRVRQAEIRRDQAKVELSYAKSKLLADMRALYSEAETALNELAGLQRASELAAESLRLTTLRYKDGEATVLEVVDAQTSFATANDNYQDGALRYRVALANLQTLTGVLPTP